MPVLLRVPADGGFVRLRYDIAVLEAERPTDAVELFNIDQLLPVEDARYLGLRQPDSLGEVILA